MLSHYSAGWLWGISKASPLPIHVTTPIPRKLHLPVQRHHSRILRAEDCALREGIPVTGLPRTFLDLAAAVRFGRLRRYIERSEELGLFDLGPVEELLARSRGHRGAKPLSRAIAIYSPAAVLRSNLERDFLTLVLESGLPRPSTNYVAHGFELDVYWPEQRFAVELDTYETHGTHEAFERDRLRQEDLKLVGIEMTRITDNRLAREPDGIVARLRRFLGLSPSSAA